MFSVSRSCATLYEKTAIFRYLILWEHLVTSQGTTIVLIALDLSQLLTLTVVSLIILNSDLDVPYNLSVSMQQRFLDQ